MNVVRLDTDTHHAIQALLPWYARNCLDGDEAAQVEAHLATCPRCRAELDLEHRLQEAQVPSATKPGDVERGWARMRALMRADVSHGQPTRASWMRWALGVQFAVIALLAAVLVLPGAGTEAYHALGAVGSTVNANAIVMFRPDATEQQMRDALRGSAAQLVAGPTASNTYLVNVPGDGRVAAIARLRAQPAVSLAESLEAGSRR